MAIQEMKTLEGFLFIKKRMLTGLVHTSMPWNLLFVTQNTNQFPHDSQQGVSTRLESVLTLEACGSEQ